jgi:hypothetical protein
MEHYIREKYEKKSFMGSQRGVEPVRIKEGSGGPGYASASAGGQYRDEVSKLRDMGFSNAEASLAALRKTNGDLNAAVSLLVKASAANAAATSASAAPATASMEQRLSALSSMGFKDEVRHAAHHAYRVKELALTTPGSLGVCVAGGEPSCAGADQRQCERGRESPGQGQRHRRYVQARQQLKSLSGADAHAGPAAAKPAASPAKAPANLLGDDLFGDAAPAASAAPAAGGFDAFGGFGAAPPAQAARPQAAPAPAAATSADLFSGTRASAKERDAPWVVRTRLTRYAGADFVATSAAPAAKPSKNDILGLYGAAPPPQATGPSFGAPVSQQAPQQAFYGGAPAGFGGAPQGAYGAAPGGYGAAPGGYGAPTGAYGAPAGYGGAPTGAYGAPAGAYGAPAGAYGAPGGYGGAPAGAYGAPAGYGGGAPPGAYGAAPGGYGGAPGGNPFGAPAAAAAPGGGAGGYNPYNTAGFTQPPPGPAPGNPFASSGAAKPSAQQDPFSALSWK